MQNIEEIFSIPGDLQANPFPLFLTYPCDAENGAPYEYTQFRDHPEYFERLTNILEDKLQTKIALSVRTRAYTDEERQIQINAKLSPYELDCQNEPGLAKLKELFAAELVYSQKIKKATLTQEENDDGHE